MHETAIPQDQTLAPSRRRGLKTLLAATLALLVPAAAQAQAQAQAYPSKPVTILVPFAAGSTTDLIARMLTQRLPELLGQPVIIDNKPGAAGSIGTAVAARAPADGYTLLFTSPAHSVNINLYPNLSWDPIKSFAPILLVGSIPNVMAVKSSAPWKTLGEFVTYAKGNPGKLNYATTGVGTSPHLMTELLKQQAGIDLLHIPYKGSSEAYQALRSGDVTVAPLGVLVAKTHIDSGELRALAVTGSKRSPVLPNVPTFAESGYPNYDVRPWQAIFAPAGTPRTIVTKLNAAFTAALNTPEIKSKLLQLGLDMDMGSPEDLAKFLQADVTRWAKVIKDGGIKLE